MDRDLNAAINLKNNYLINIRSARSKLTLGENKVLEATR